METLIHISLIQQRKNIALGHVLGVADHALRYAQGDTVVSICVQDDGATDGAAVLGSQSEDGPGVYI
jgi:hypothetical protein